MKANRNIIALIAIVLVTAACNAAPPTPPLSLTHQTPVVDLSVASLSVYPDDSAEDLLTRIAAAHQRVLLSIYLLNDTRFIKALGSASRNGATVRVLLEQHPIGDTTSGQDAYLKLRAIGVETRYANPVFRLTHEKSIVIDKSAVIQTANMTNSGFRYNREFGLLINDATVVKEMAAVFNADWFRTEVIPTNPYLVWSPENSRQKLTAIVTMAHSRLDVYAEEVQDDNLTQALIYAATKGISVKLLTSPPLDNSSDANSVDLDRLERGGVQVRYLIRPYIHAKVFVVDDTLAFIGSQNISATSIEFNRELGVIVTNPVVIQRVEDTFSNDWNAASDR